MQCWPYYIGALISCQYTVNATGETLVLNKDFPSIKQGFYQHNGGKVGKIVIFPALKGSAFASLTSVENSDICQKLFFYFDKFLSNVWKLVRSHHRQRNDIHLDALQFPEITNLTSVQLILTNVRMKYLSRHIFSLKQQLVRQNRLRRFDSDKCQWGRCMAHHVHYGLTPQTWTSFMDAPNEIINLYSKKPASLPVNF